jgi:hypothetical protein
MSSNRQEADAVSRVDTFIQRLHDLDLVISPTAVTTRFVKPDENPAWDSGISLTDKLSGAIMEYEISRHNQAQILQNALKCLTWINKAYAGGFVKEGPGLIRKHKEAEAKVGMLSTKVDELTADNLFLKAKIDLMDQGRKF